MDFPAPMPPVNPTTNTAGDRSTGEPAKQADETVNLAALAPMRKVVSAISEERTTASRDGSGDGHAPAEAERSVLSRLERLGETTDGSAAESSLAERVDRAGAFAPAILAVRWATIITSLAIVLTDQLGQSDTILVWGGILLAHTVIRTLRPAQYWGNLRSLVTLLGELAFVVLAVSTTGGWASPFLLLLINPIALAGFARGFGFAIRIAALAALAVTAPYLADGTDAARLRDSGQWGVVLLLVALIAGYARRISGEADRQRSLALDRVGRLSDANALLFSLHRITQTLPASLDLDDVLDTTVTRLRGLFELEYAGVLLRNDMDGSWDLAAKEGARIPRHLTSAELPPPLRRALEVDSVVCAPSLADRGEHGLAAKAAGGVYAPLMARGSVIGLVAVEHGSTSKYGRREVDLMKGFVDTVALAIDNARWFARLRTVGADEERTRIARDLHDRIGQSLAYLAFELDRIVSRHDEGEALDGDLQRLRGDVRGVIGEVRDTLYDLRTDVTDANDLPTVLEQFAERVRERSDLDVRLHLDRDHRLPLLQERELWRIAQEAITNVERHAGARRVRVLWRCDGRSAALDITDDGQGFPMGNAGRLDSYGILGMRERAASIGATLDLRSEPGKGTRVRATLLATDAPSAPVTVGAR